MGPRLAQGGAQGGSRPLTPQLPSPGADSEVKEEAEEVWLRVDAGGGEARQGSPGLWGLSLGVGSMGVSWRSGASRVPLVWALCPAGDVWDPRT